ncbi:hypothetical protein [Coleofasciculus sp. E1-EBD-02]|uniref:hypothetical protein n=1 Tax=Coleofasciculus sp. E1-EBD-02 TaxID=3068481 RepID=UPI0032F6320F
MVIVHLSLVICHWSFVFGHLSLVFCHWSFVIGHLSFVIRHLSYVRIKRRRKSKSYRFIRRLYLQIL